MRNDINRFLEPPLFFHKFVNIYQFMCGDLIIKKRLNFSLITTYYSPFSNVSNITVRKVVSIYICHAIIDRMDQYRYLFVTIHTEQLHVVPSFEVRVLVNKGVVHFLVVAFLFSFVRAFYIISEVINDCHS